MITKQEIEDKYILVEFYDWITFNTTWNKLIERFQIKDGDIISKVSEKYIIVQVKKSIFTKQYKRMSDNQKMIIIKYQKP